MKDRSENGEGEKFYIIKKLWWLFLLIAVPVLLLTWGLIATKPTGAIHVDPSAAVAGPGYSWWPEKSLHSALETMKEREVSQRQISLAGTHEGIFFIPDQTMLTGTQNAEIVGEVTVRGEVVLEDFRISGEGRGIILATGGDLHLKGMQITDNVHNGIELISGSKILVEDSTLEGNRKGLYAKSNSNVVVRNSLVTRNIQEGIDIWEKSTSEISDNTIVENGESGIELLVGSSKNITKNNTLKDNGKSGLVLEYARYAPEIGEITISENQIVDNTEKGLHCVSRTGGKRIHRYFAKSADPKDNQIRNNQEGDIAKTCNFGSVEAEEDNA